MGQRIQAQDPKDHHQLPHHDSHMDWQLCAIGIYLVIEKTADEKL
jgi:hypothetical protein